MNKTLHQLLSAAQHTAGAALYGAGKQAGALAQQARRGARLVSLKASVHARLRTVGQMLYDTHSGHPADSEQLLQTLQEIDTLNEEIARCRPDRPDLRRCPTCAAQARPGDQYCRQCGQKL